MAGQTRSGMGMGATIGMPPAGPVTRWLCGLLIATSILASISQRKFGIGAQDLIFDMESLQRLELWRLITHIFVKTQPFALLLSTLVLFLFGRSCESSWGSREFLRFFLVSAVGAAILAVPLHHLLNFIMPFDDLGRAEGPDAAIDAMLVALALNAPDAQVLFGFILPLPARTLIWLLVAIDMISGALTGAATLSVTLGGMLMGYLLVTRTWRPDLLWTRWRLTRLRARRRGIHVVPPRSNRNLN